MGRSSLLTALVIGAHSATTALAAPACPAPGVTPEARLRRWAVAVRWVGLHQAGTASKAAEICPAGSSMLQILLSCRAPERATAVSGPGEG